MDLPGLGGLASLAEAGGLLTPQNPPVKVICSAFCPPGQVLVVDPLALDLDFDLPEDAKVIVTPTEKVRAEISAAVEGFGLELLP